MRTLNIKKIQNNIQTLRALSVLCVVFYHAKLVLFNKILITKNIFKKKTRNSIQKASVKRALDIVSSLI